MLATGAVILWAPDSELTYDTFAAAIGFPMAVILPMVAILSVTAEWSQRSGLTTFTLVPHRGRTILAKGIVAVSVAVGSMVLAFTIGALGNLAGAAIAGVDTVWDITAAHMLLIVLGNVLGLMVGFMLGVVMRNSAGAIVGYFVYSFVLPTLSMLLADGQQWFRDLQPWVDFNFAQGQLFDGSMTGEQWANLGVSGAIWLVAPLAVGLAMLMRSEVKCHVTIPQRRALRRSCIRSARLVSPARGKERRMTGDTYAEATTPDEIDELARRARDGDRNALELLLGAVRPRTLNICRGVLPYTPDAEDACQEALMNVAAKIGSWGGRGRFTTWLHVVAVNSARSTYRRMKNQAVPADPHAAGPLERPDPRTTSVIAGTRLDLLEAMESIERDHPQYVEPLLLRDVYGMSYEDIAQQVGAPLGTVKAQIHHGRKLARPLLRGQE